VSGVQRLSQGCERNVLIMKEVSWKNKLRFVKDVLMICVNLIVIVVVVPEKKKDITFVQRSCTIGMLSL
jgi:hypothetical protein